MLRSAEDVGVFGHFSSWFNEHTLADTKRAPPELELNFYLFAPVRKPRAYVVAATLVTVFASLLQCRALPPDKHED